MARHIIIILTMLCVQAKAQSGFGLELGLGASTYKFAPSTTPIDYTSASVSSIFSGKLGVMADLQLNKHFYFQTGLYASRKGAYRSFSYYRNDSFNESVQQTLAVYYAEVPISVVYKTGSQGKGRFIFGLAAVPSYIIGGHSHIKDAGAYNDTPFNTSGTDKVIVGTTLHGFDIGVSISGGYELPTGLFFRVYYTSGVNDIGTQSEIDKNRMFGIAAGYIFGNGRNIKKDTENLIDKDEQVSPK